MKHALIFSITLLIISCSSAAIWGDINLGSGFYYMVDPTFNSINLSTSKDDPMRSSQYVITNVEYIGFDKNYILAINNTNDTIRYWVIDKTQKNLELGYANSPDKDGRDLLNLANVTKSVDSTNFKTIKDKYKIELHSKYYYRKESNYH